MMRAYSHAHSNTRAQVENSDHTRRVKTGFCRLVCLVMSKRHLVTFKQEMRFRNKILDRIVSFVSTGTAGLSPHTSCCLCVCVCVSLSLSLSLCLCACTLTHLLCRLPHASPPHLSLSPGFAPADHASTVVLDLDIAAVQAMAALLLGLPLQPLDDDVQDPVGVAVQ